MDANAISKLELNIKHVRSIYSKGTRVFSRIREIVGSRSKSFELMQTWDKTKSNAKSVFKIIQRIQIKEL